MTQEPAPSVGRRLAVFLGLAYPVGGEPLPGAPRRSRFGRVSPRRDQERDQGRDQVIEDLHRRVAELERLGRTPDDPISVDPTADRP